MRRVRVMRVRRFFLSERLSDGCAARRRCEAGVARRANRSSAPGKRRSGTRGSAAAAPAPRRACSPPARYRCARAASARSACAAAANPKLAVTHTLEPKPAQLSPVGPGACASVAACIATSSTSHTAASG